MRTSRKQVILAVVGSLALHVLVLLAWAVAVQYSLVAQADPDRVEAASQPVSLEVVQTQPTPSLFAEPTPPPKPLAFLDTADAPDANLKPNKDAIQAERDARASSELPAEADTPVPTQKGREVPQFMFDPHPAIAGDEQERAGESKPPDSAPDATPPPTQPPAPKRTMVAMVSPPDNGPTDPRDMTMPSPGSLPVQPSLAEENPYDPSFRPPATLTEPPRPTPVPRRSSYRPLQERNASSGNLLAAGVASVDSQATPLGRYVGTVVRTLRPLWNRYADAHIDVLSLGTARIHFVVERDGRIRETKVISNTGSEALVAVSLRALADVRVPAMPEEVAAACVGGRLPLDINFNTESGD